MKSAVFIERGATSVQKKPKLLDRLQEGIFKGEEWGGSHRVCDQLVYNSLIGQ